MSSNKYVMQRLETVSPSHVISGYFHSILFFYNSSPSRYFIQNQIIFLLTEIVPAPLPCVSHTQLYSPSPQLLKTSSSSSSPTSLPLPFSVILLPLHSLPSLSYLPPSYPIPNPYSSPYTISFNPALLAFFFHFKYISHQPLLQLSTPNHTSLKLFSSSSPSLSPHIWLISTCSAVVVGTR